MELFLDMRGIWAQELGPIFGWISTNLMANRLNEWLAINWMMNQIFTWEMVASPNIHLKLVV